jgi:hypothetical protein
MKAFKTSLFAILIAAAGEAGTFGQAAPAPGGNASASPAPNTSAAPPATPSTAPSGTAAAPPAANPSAPPAAPTKRSQADLEKLVAPIALYPDSLIATLLPASAYPLEVVEAARFVKDTNNISKVDTQNWDDNVKAIAHFPEVINQMNDNLSWTSDLGDAFINQPKEIMDAVQTMRDKAQQSGALKTTPQQVVTVTNTIVTNTVENQIVYVTNETVQIQPAQPDVMYVPQYNPTVVYAGYPVAYPGYYYPPAGSVLAASAVSFGVGMACGAIMANNCDWYHGGCWGGSYHSDVNVNRNVNVNNSFNRNANINTANVNRGQKWQPDQNRLKNSGSSLSSAQSREARGYPAASTASARAGSTTPRASPSASSGSRLSPTGPENRPSSSPNVSRPSSSPSSPNASRPSSSPNVSRPSSESYNRPSSAQTQQRSAFSGGGSSAETRQASNRGSYSRSGGGGYQGGGGGRR